MKLNRRSFFAALTAPVLAPLRKLLPATPAAPALKPANLSDYYAPGSSYWMGIDRAIGKSATVLQYWGPKGLYVFDGEGKHLISEHNSSIYWHGQMPFVRFDLSGRGADFEI